MQAIGVDIGGTNLRVARVAADGKVLDECSTNTGITPTQVAEAVVRMVKGLDGLSVVGVGVGVPGRVDFPNRKVRSGGFVDLSANDLVTDIENALGKPCILETDANLALLAEQKFGAGRGATDAVLLTIGTGIGGAALVGGQILRGKSSGGQFGHVTVDHTGLPCACGRRGCVETTSSGTALGRILMEAGFAKGTRVETVLKRAETGDPDACRVIECWALPLRAAIDSIIASLDPQKVILGGGLGTVACHALNFAPGVSAWFQADVVPAQLGDRAGVVGGAWAVLTDQQDLR